MNRFYLLFVQLIANCSLGFQIFKRTKFILLLFANCSLGFQILRKVLIKKAFNLLFRQLFTNCTLAFRIFKRAFERTKYILLFARLFANYELGLRFLKNKHGYWGKKNIHCDKTRDWGGLNKNCKRKKYQN